MDTKGVGKSAGRSLRTSTNITRRQRKEKQEDKMGSITGSFVSLKPYMEKTATHLQPQIPILVTTFVSTQVAISLPKQTKKSFIILTISIVKASASLTPLILTHHHLMMAMIIIALRG